MEKKRSVGITIVGTIKIFISILFLLFFIFVVLVSSSLTDSSIKQPLFNSLFEVIIFVCVVIFGLVYLINSVFIFKLNKFSRRISIFLDVIMIMLIAFLSFIEPPGYFKKPDLLTFIISSLLWTFFIYFIFYLTRPKVKELFR